MQLKWKKKICAVTDWMYQKWFVKFCAGDFLLDDDAPQSVRAGEVDRDQIENNQCYTMWEIADILQIPKFIQLFVKNVSFILWKKPKRTFWSTLWRNWVRIRADVYTTPVTLWAPANDSQNSLWGAQTVVSSPHYDCIRSTCRGMPFLMKYKQYNTWVHFLLACSADEVFRDCLAQLPGKGWWLLWEVVFVPASRNSITYIFSNCWVHQTLIALPLGTRFHCDGGVPCS